MLEGMRNTANQGLTILVFGAIIVVFALNFGPGSVSQCGGRTPRAATVNGRVISEAEFTRQYAATFANMAQFRPGYTVEQAKAEGLKSTVLEQMIGEELLAQEAEARGLVVTPEELREEIKKIPFFQTDGKFDRQKYSQYARFQNLSEAKFEEDYSRTLLSRKMRQALEDLAVVSPAEVKEQWESRNNRADIEFVKVDPAFYREELKADPAAIQKLIAEDQKALEEYFNKHASRYNEPRRVRARHILAKVPENAPDADVQKAKEKIEAAKKRVDGGEDFAKVAREVSEDGSAANGGDLGLQGPGVWVKPFEDEANRLKPGEVGNVIRSRFGFHVIKVEEVKEATKRELKDVQEEVAKLVWEERATKQSARAFADKLLADAKAGKTLTELLPAPAEGQTADPLAPKAEATGWFNKGTKYIPRLGVAPDVVNAVFAAEKPGMLDKVFEVNDRFYVVNVKEREKPDEAKFEEERASIEDGLKMQKRNRVVQDFIKERRNDTRSAKVVIEPEVIRYDVAQSSSPNPMQDF
ncbi:MAG: SurA N-terminal domain-containing protein [Myxococcota bacterium]